MIDDGEIRDAETQGKMRSAMEELCGTCSVVPEIVMPDELEPERALHIAKSAAALLAFFSRNVGDSAEWPVRIVVDSPETGTVLTMMLDDLQNALNLQKGRPD